jgi:hypothetical protein
MMHTVTSSQAIKLKNKSFTAGRLFGVMSWATYVGKGVFAIMIEKHVQTTL